MQGVFISDEREGETPATIVARQGRFIPNPNNYSLTLRLNNGTIHRLPAKEKKSTYQIIGFSTYDVNLDLGKQLNSSQSRYRSRGELSWAELTLAESQANDKRTELRLSVEKHKRIAIAFAPLVFGLVGVPLGLQSNRSGKGAGFALALGISLVYYLLLSISSTLAGKGMVPTVIALWVPNCCFLIGGSYFLHRTAIEQPMRILNAPVQFIKNLSPSKYRKEED